MRQMSIILVAAFLAPAVSALAGVGDGLVSSPNPSQTVLVAITLIVVLGIALYGAYLLSDELTYYIRRALLWVRTPPTQRLEQGESPLQPRRRRYPH